MNVSSFSPNSRRGISSVVGALIFTVLMIAGFSAMSLALDTQTDIVNTQRVMADTELKKQQEQFGIMVFTDANNILNISVDNKGQNPVEISRVWITNKTLATQPTTPFSVNSNDAFIPTGFTSNVFSTQPLYIVPDTYDVKVVSTLGTVKTAELTVGSAFSSTGLRAELITDPPDVIIGQNVTIAMLVTNTGSSTIENVAPGSLTVTPLSVLASSSPTPVSVDLTPGESVMFSWDYTISGPPGNDVSFSSYASGTDIDGPVVISNTVSDVSTLRLPTDGGVGNPDPDILHDDLLARPQLFLTIPGTHGDSDDQALWGVNIANPVNAPMRVSKLTITAFAPGANNNDKIFTAGCGPATNIAPAGTSYWACPSENLVMWENYETPITIPPNSTQSFLVRVTPGSLAAVTHLESIIVQASVFTNVGSFGKSGYQTTMFDGSDALGSVYLSNVVDSRNNNDIQSSRIGIAPGSDQTFNIVFADLDTRSSTYVKSGGKLVINVPKGWTNVTILNNYGFVSNPTLIIHGDGSHQITAQLSSNLGSTSNQADTIQFRATAPTITTDQMYVMYVLAEGETNNNFAIGPLSEIVLQVDAS
jgi:hypothetical protein